MKNKKETIDQIVQDLLKFDPSFKENEVRALVVKLSEACPDTNFDERFAKQLKAKVLKEFDELVGSKNMKKTFSWPKVDWRMMSYVSASSAALVLLAVVASSMSVYKQNSLSLGYDSPSIANQITKVGRNAFGPLAMARNANQDNAKYISGVENSLNASSQAAPTNEMNVASEIARLPSATAGMGGGGVASSKVASDSVMPPAQGSIKYVYTGDDFEVPTGQVEVYKKLPPAMSNFSSVISALNNMNVDSLDVSKFKSLELDSLSIKENREYGYYLSLSPANNVFYMSKNWDKWPNPSADCRDDSCWQKNRVKISDMPSDEEAISIAKAFIKEYRIDVSGYGEPVIQDSWRGYYESSTDKDNYYLPEEIYVVYPLMIKGTQVKGQGGEAQGLSVGVDVRAKRATGFNGTIAPSFESSEYDSVSSKDGIIKMAEEAGINGQVYYYSPDGRGDERTIELGTPELSLIQYWRYDQSTGKNDELYIPAYIFPVKGDLGDMYYIRSVVVPLIKEVYDEYPHPVLMKESLPVPTPAIDIDMDVDKNR